MPGSTAILHWQGNASLRAAGTSPYTGKCKFSGCCFKYRTTTLRSCAFVAFWGTQYFCRFLDFCSGGCFSLVPLHPHRVHPTFPILLHVEISPESGKVFCGYRAVPHSVDGRAKAGTRLFSSQIGARRISPKN